MAQKKSPITTNEYRTHTCGELGDGQVGDLVRLSGWVATRRDHGGLIFIDLRDKWGITQITFDPSKQKDAWEIAEGLRSEFVIRVEGTVRQRPAKMVNKKIQTGAIEIEATSVEILNTSKTPPFEIGTNVEVNEELRLKYRFLDLRHPRRQEILRVRDKFIQHIRSYMQTRDFTEVQTPILTSSSPEGARDYLVPSRLHPGEFYALPQAPQQFKQLLMVGGLDRYFQVAPAFRDEDPRIDRHTGAFYQLDMEMSYVAQEDVWAVIEPLMVELTETFTKRKVLASPFPRLTWHEAIGKYGSDKPDLRYDLFITDVSEVVSGSGFKVFSDAIENKDVVLALHVPGGAALSRSDIDALTEVAGIHGAKGLAYVLHKDELTSPIIKHLGADVAAAVAKEVGQQKGDAVFFAAAPWEQAAKILGAVRVAAANKLDLADEGKAAWAWITDFPMYERDTETGKIDFSHNPFSMPQGGLEALDTDDPTSILGYQYDIVLNGFEISSGAIRNHRPDIMYKAFEIAGYTKEEVDAKFGGMIRAFEYGAPPHGGFAPGIDRLLFVLLGEKNIREIYAFPKDGHGRDLMMGAPSPVKPDQLKDLHIDLQGE
ncbi:aspartate--tRNA ligase [bacterium]|nr:aspartate--tRNA ligase [bacterium]